MKSERSNPHGVDWMSFAGSMSAWRNIGCGQSESLSVANVHQRFVCGQSESSSVVNVHQRFVCGQSEASSIVNVHERFVCGQSGASSAVNDRQRFDAPKKLFGLRHMTGGVSEVIQL